MNTYSALLRHVQSSTVVLPCQINSYGELIEGFACVSKADYEAHKGFSNFNEIPDSITIGTGVDKREAYQCYTFAYEMNLHIDSNPQNKLVS